MRTLNKSDMYHYLNDCPYWVLEQAHKDRAANLPQICASCETLKDALDTGVNMVILVVNGENIAIGSVKADGGSYFLETDEYDIDTYPVVFDELDTDDDNFTIAYFKPLEK